MPKSLCLALMLVFAWCATQPSANAQNADQQAICQKFGVVDECAALASEARRKTITREGNQPNLDPLSNLGPFVQEHAAAAFASVVANQLKGKAEALALQAVSTRAAVNQAGAANTSGTGSTNLVSKPTSTDFISLASESGAFTDTLNGTSATIQANANGLAKLFTKHPIFSMDAPSYAQFLQPLNFTVTLNVAQSSGTTTAPTSGGINLASVLLPSNNASFSSFQARYNIYRPNDPTSAAFHKKFLDSLAGKQNDLDTFTSDLTLKVQHLVTNVETGPEYKAVQIIWINSAKAAEKPDTTDFEALLEAYSVFRRDAYLVLSTSAGFQNAVQSMATDLNQIQTLANEAVTMARGTPLATFTYTYSEPTQQPSVHHFGVIVSYLARGGNQTVDSKTQKKTNDGARTFLSGVQFNANFQATIYASSQDLASHGPLRDLQVSAEFDKPFGGTTDNPRATWCLAGYGQYQYDPSILNINEGNLAPGTDITLPKDAQVLLGKAGWLGVAQGKLVININKGMSVPIALKWSNKTELLDAKDIRGQFGISYDLSALSSLLSKGN